MWQKEEHGEEMTGGKKTSVRVGVGRDGLNGLVRLANNRLGWVGDRQT